MILDTEHLILRELTLHDLQFLYPILSDEETMQYYPRPYSREEVRGWIERSLLSYRENNFGLWAIELKQTGVFIGQCGITLQNINGNCVPEIGYHIDRRYWNMGYGTEAAQGCLDYGFHQLQLDEIFIHTYTKNLPSIRIAQKLGMHLKAEYDKVCNGGETLMPHVVYSKKK